jgi:alpha-ketoglutarate-dependent taurine dioxygenase
VHTNPPSGGDTLWASAYEAYSRLSPEFARFLEGLEAYHEAGFFNEAAKAYGIDLRTGQRGSPLNKGEHLSAVHPVIRVNPVSGWKGLFVNKEFTRRILGVSRDESDFILDYLNVSWPEPPTADPLTSTMQRIIANNHDLQVRFKWSVNNTPGVGDVAIWDNR